MRVQAQSYPNRPIRLISPFAAGGGNDVLARVVAAKLGDRLGVSVVVENRPGAGAVIGIQTLARSAPDGYTLALGSSALAVAPTLYKKAPFDANKDFAPVALVAHYPYVLVATASLPAKTLPDLFKMAKERPGEITYASPGAATSQHLFTELLQVKTGIELRHIPYIGTAPALVDIVARRRHAQRHREQAPCGAEDRHGHAGSRKAARHDRHDPDHQKAKLIVPQHSTRVKSLRRTQGERQGV
jgi:tripartite-type tricarboxylate transporter receptor subunit TctC